MKNNPQTPRSALVLTLALSFAMTACLGDAPADQTDPSRTAPATAALVQHSAEDQSTLTDQSLYAVDAVWSNQNGQPVQLASLRGRPVVLSMVFTRCGWACPTIVQDMKRIAAQLPEDVQDEVQYVLVSMDPERDTPAVLAGFAQTHRLDPVRWTLLRGEASDVRVLAALLGIRYRKEADGQFSHTNLITVLNEEGEVVHMQKGLGSDPAHTADKLRSLLAENL